MGFTKLFVLLLMFFFREIFKACKFRKFKLRVWGGLLRQVFMVAVHGVPGSLYIYIYFFFLSLSC